MIKTTWSEIKRIAAQKGLSIQWTEADNSYHVSIVDGPFVLTCVFSSGTTETDTVDFETNYKALGNRRVDAVAPAFASKTVGSNKLFARNTGFQAAVTTGVNVLSYVIPYTWVKITGLEIVGCSALDVVNMKVLDTAAGSYSGVPNLILNQFGYTVNLPNDYYIRTSSFDADLYQGMTVRIEYTSISDKTVGINLIMAEVK